LDAAVSALTFRRQTVSRCHGFGHIGGLRTAASM